jgi:starch phosphorylase
MSRALGLLCADKPIQVVMAGKAHPRDEEAKRIVQVVFGMKSSPIVGARVAFLEDYDMAAAARLVAGCDVWINVPRPPLEASGTSGMKAMLNGCLNLSVLDGWWEEAWDPTNGWAIHSEPGPDNQVQDAHDSDELYSLLEREVVPLFHARDASGIPHAWLSRVKTALRTLGPRFNAGRMLLDYWRQQYPRG